MWSLFCRLTYVLGCTYENDHRSFALQNTYNRKNLSRSKIFAPQLILFSIFGVFLFTAWSMSTWKFISQEPVNSRIVSGNKNFVGTGKQGDSLETQIRTGDKNLFSWRSPLKEKVKEKLSKSCARKILKNHMKNFMIYTLNSAKTKRLLWSLKNK